MPEINIGGKGICPECGEFLEEGIHTCGRDLLIHNEGVKFTPMLGRTPDLTEALKRLKALEERMKRDGVGFASGFYDEIAAIRKMMGASDAEPTPEPEP